MRYDHEALVGILALEAHRAGAVVVGEDLGTVEPWVRDYLRERGHPRHLDPVVREGRRRAGRCAPEHWRELCLATVTTHDLPPTAGYLAGEHIRLRDELGLLTRPVEEERAGDARRAGGRAGRCCATAGCCATTRDRARRSSRRCTGSSPGPRPG